MKKSNLPIAVIGLGKTGISVAKYLFNNNINFIIYDTRKNPEFFIEAKKFINSKKIILGGISKEIIDYHDNFIISPGLELDKNLIKKIYKDKKNLLTDIDIFNDKKRNNLICITGSNGKTTVTLLIEHILINLGKKAKAGGNIGFPVLELLRKDYEYNIIELSSFQLEMLEKINCEVSLITNITPDHLDRHKSLDNYIKIKHKIFNNTKNIIINRCDKNIKKEEISFKYSFGDNIPKNKNEFGIKKINGTNNILFGKKKMINENEVLLIGKHNLVNICSALSVIQALGLNMDEACKHVKTFTCIEHRMENFFNKSNIRWINDSKATNIDSTVSALNSLDNNIILILGGKSKTDDYKKLNDAISKKVDQVILLGESKNIMLKQITAVNNIAIVDTIENAVIKAKEFATKLRDESKIPVNIILSPACSSYDMFKSYEERGQLFKECALNQYR